MTSAAHPRYLRRQPGAQRGHLRFHARRLSHCFWPLRHHRTVVLSGQSTARQTDAARYCYLRLLATACALVAQRPELIGGAWSSSSLPGCAALTSTHSQPVIHRVSQPSGAFHPLQTSNLKRPAYPATGCETDTLEAHHGAANGLKHPLGYSNYATSIPLTHSSPRFSHSPADQGTDGSLDCPTHTTTTSS